jgi:hypothetical protein
VGVLEGIDSPADLRDLPPAQLDALADEIRDFLVDRVSRTGGHLGPNLGVVELTIALHRVFDSPTDVPLTGVGTDGLGQAHVELVHLVLVRAIVEAHVRVEAIGRAVGIPGKTLLEPAVDAERVHELFAQQAMGSAEPGRNEPVGAFRSRPVALDKCPFPTRIQPIPLRSQWLMKNGRGERLRHR